MEILILGAGFSGLAAVNKLYKELKPLIKCGKCTITVIDKNVCSAIVPVLPDFCGQKVDCSMICQKIPDLLPKSINFVHEEVSSINLNFKKVTTNQNKYYYDHLIIASGSTTNFFKFRKNIDKLYPLVNVREAIKLRNDFLKYLNTNNKYKLIISGAGYTGVELAFHLNDVAKKLDKKLNVILIEKSNIVFPFLCKTQRDYVEKYIHSNKFKLYVNTSIADFDGKNITLSTGETIGDVFVCWTTGTKFSIDDIEGEIETIPDGRIKVNEFLQLSQYKEVYAVGDSAAIIDKNTYLRKAVNFSIYSGEHAAINVANEISQKPFKNFKPVDLGWMLPLGQTSVGKILDKINVQGKFGMRLHYLMSGIRNYNLKNRLKFFLLAIKI